MMKTDEHSAATKSVNHDLLRLSLIPGIGPKTVSSLFERFSDADTILSASPDQLQTVSGVGPKLAKEVALARRTINVDAVIQLCEQNQIDITDSFSNEYPAPLKEIHNPPITLYSQGELQESDAFSIAVVGSRHATGYGKRVAERLAQGLANAGYTIVSGLARGIDAAAHRGALNAGGRTIAVLGSGVLEIYPPEHVSLADEIRQNGAVISETAPHHPPKSGAFPQRNRIISGLCLGTLVVEAADRSGALITARLAMEQGREVFAVPGSIESQMSRGCHQLLRDGATLVGSIDDILDQLGPLANPVRINETQKMQHPAELRLNEQEQIILAAIDQCATELDEIVSKTQLPIARVLATISVLEIKRLIRRVSGNSVAKI